MFSEQKWRDSLKPGDKVLVSRGSYGRRYAAGVVERITKTRIILKGGEAFFSRNGWLVGGGTWSTVFLVEPTPEIYAEIMEERLRSHCQRLLRDAKVPETLKDVERMILALESFVPKKEEAQCEN